MDTYISKELMDGRLKIYDGLSHNTDDEKYYELKMITGNLIPVFLSCRKVYEDDREEYVYDTTSMISLYDLSKLKLLTFIELKLLLESITKCQQAIENYLLSGEGLILDPEYVFFDRLSREFKYCFFPWNNRDKYSSYTKMTEFLLSAIDYKDEKAVDAAYSVYASVLNKDYELKKYIINDSDNTEMNGEANSDMHSEGRLSVTENLAVKLSENQDNNPGRARLKTSSIVCLTALVIFSVFLIALLLYSRRLFFYIFGDMKSIAVSVLIFSILIYFPVMDIVSKT